MAQDRIDDFKEQVLANVERHGFHLQGVFESETSPSFTYTVGLTRTHDLPELILIGVPFQTAAHLLSTIVNRLLAGTARALPGEEISEVANFPLRLCSVERAVATKWMNVAN